MTVSVLCFAQGFKFCWIPFEVAEREGEGAKCVKKTGVVIAVGFLLIYECRMS